MGLRINSLLNAGYKILERKKTSGATSSEYTPVSNPLEEVSTENSKARRFSSGPSKVSDSINSAYALSQLQSSPKRTDLEPITRDELSNDSTQSSTPAMRFFEEGPDILLNESNPIPDASQEDLNLLREAILKEVELTALSNPSISEVDLQTAIDDKFGEGLSEIIGLRIEDQGFGESDVKFSQTNWSELSEDQKSLFSEAAAFAKENYASKSDLAEPKSTRGNKFLESASHRIQSGRYDSSYSPDEVAETSALTDNTDFLASISRR